MARFKVNQDKRSNEYIILKSHYYLFLYFITIPLYIGLFFILKDWVFPFFNLYIMYPMVWVTIFAIMGITILDIILRTSLEQMVTQKFRTNKIMATEFNYHQSILLSKKEKLDRVNFIINNRFLRDDLSKAEKIVNVYSDVSAMKYYFKKNKDIKTSKEIVELEDKYKNGQLSLNEAYPYDLGILKEYYVNLFMKITSFPFFSIPSHIKRVLNKLSRKIEISNLNIRRKTEIEASRKRIIDELKAIEEN